MSVLLYFVFLSLSSHLISTYLETLAWCKMSPNVLPGRCLVSPHVDITIVFWIKYNYFLIGCLARCVQGLSQGYSWFWVSHISLLSLLGWSQSFCWIPCSLTQHVGRCATGQMTTSVNFPFMGCTSLRSMGFLNLPTRFILLRHLDGWFLINTCRHILATIIKTEQFHQLPKIPWLLSIISQCGWWFPQVFSVNPWSIIRGARPTPSPHPCCYNLSELPWRGMTWALWVGLCFRTMGVE